MFNNIHQSPSPSPNQTSQQERKRAPNSAPAALNDVQPLERHKKIKTQSSVLNTATLREARRYTSEPYAAGIKSVRDDDILMGRGGFINAHLGNIQLRALITHGSPTVAPIDLQTHGQLPKTEKKKICLELLQEVHSTIPRIRFLQQSKQDALYYEIHDERAISKIAQTIRDLRNKLPENESTSIENKSAPMTQYASLENQQEDEPTPYHALFSQPHDHLHGLHTYPDLGLFLDQLSEENNDQKPAATSTVRQTTDEFEPIPVYLAASEAYYIQEIRNNPSLHLLAAISDDNNDRKPAAEPIKHQTSQLKSSARAWTIEEDQLLTAEMSRLDPSGLEKHQDWSYLSGLIPTHTSKSIRERWVNHLNPILDKTPFSNHEYDQLKTGVEQYGKHWVQISENIFGSKRAENTIKNQFYASRFKTYIINNYGVQTYNQLIGK